MMTLSVVAGSVGWIRWFPWWASSASIAW